MALTPWKHQEDVIPKLLEMNFLLFWETGAGKTYPLLHAASLRGGRALYLAPPAIRTQVALEAQRFGFYAASDVQVLETRKDSVRPGAKLVVCSYELLYDPALWKQLYSLEWSTLILDEGHLLKNSAAKRTRAVYGATVDSKGALVRRAQRVWVASGTPVVNDPSDLWTHISRLFPNILNQLHLKTKYDWIARFCVTKVTPWGEKVIGAKNMAELRHVLEPVSSRVRKEDVLDLPPLIVSELWVPPQSLDLSDVPEEALDELQRLLAKDEDFSALATPLATLRRKIGMAKAGHVADLVVTDLENNAEKVLVFYQHVTVGDWLVRWISRRPWLKGAVLQYEGGMPPSKRDAVVKAFMEDPTKKVLVAQIQAAGTGLNLQACQRVYIVEPPWTPAACDQAISRVYRGGQKKSCYVSLVCLAQSVDMSITSALKRKLTILKELA